MLSRGRERSYNTSHVHGPAPLNGSGRVRVCGALTSILRRATPQAPDTATQALLASARHPPTPTPICQRSQGKLPPSAAPYAGWSQRNTSVYTPPLPLSFPAVVNGWHPSAFRNALSGVSHVARRLRGGVRRRRPGGVRAAEYVPALRCEAAPSRRRRTPAPPRGGPARRRTGRRQPWPACTAASAGAVSRVRRSRRRRNGWTDGGTDTDRSDAELETSGERRRWCV